METESDEALELELKYCERCGGLWLRVQGVKEVYCALCAVAMSEVAMGYRSRRVPRLPIRHDIDAHYIATANFCGKGGHA